VKAFISITICLGVMLLVVAMGEVGRDFTPRIAYTNSLATGGSTAHVYMDFETGNDGDAWVTNNSVGSALLTNAISTGSSLGVWRIVTNGGFVNSNTLLRVSTTEAHRGTRSFRMRPTQDNSYMDWGLFIGFPKVAVSYWIRHNVGWSGDDGSHDITDFRSLGGDFIINNLDTQTPTSGTNRLKYGAHTGEGVGTQFTWATNYWYNVQILYDTATKGALVRWYTNGVSMGTSSNLITTGTPGVMRFFRMGMCDDHNQLFDAFTYIDDFEIWTNGTWPNTPVGGF